MKNVKSCYCLLIFLFSLSTVIFAQVKPTSGSVFEVGFVPFSSSSPIINKMTFKSINGLITYRSGIDFDFYKNNSVSTGDGKASRCKYLIGLSLGKEYHRSGTERLSPYFGYVVGSSYNYVEQTNKDSYDVDIINGWLDYSDNSDYQYLIDRSSINVYTNGLIGADYYIAKDFYIGFDVSYGFTYSIYPSVRSKMSIGDNDEVTIYSSSYSFGLGKSDNSTLNLGYRF